jgi:hypothetical protein
MIETREQVRRISDFQQEWLKTRDRFGDLVEAETLKVLASEGFKQFGRGVICLAIRRGQPSCFYIPGYRLSLFIPQCDDQWQLLERVKTYKPEKSEILVLVTFNDIEISQTGYYQYFYLCVS